MSICIQKSAGSPVVNDDNMDIVVISGTNIDSCSEEHPKYCTLCYEPYEKIILTSSQAKSIFRVLCKCLRVKSANTAFDFNCGSDFPLCESCSEFALDLVKLYKKLEAIRETIQEKVEEVIETVIETELARKEKILKIRDSQFKDIKHDRRVDSFRKQVIKSCEEIASSYGEGDTEEKSLERDPGFGDEHPYADAFRNFKVKKEIFENTPCETEAPFLDLTGDSDDSNDKHPIKDTSVIKYDTTGSESILEPPFKEPSPFVSPPINIKFKTDVKIKSMEPPFKEAAAESKLSSKKLEIGSIVQSKEMPIDDKIVTKDDLAKLKEEPEERKWHQEITNGRRKGEFIPFKKLEINSISQPSELESRHFPSKETEVDDINKSKEPKGAINDFIPPSKKLEIRDDETLVENKEPSAKNEQLNANATTTNPESFTKLNNDYPVVVPSPNIESDQDSNETTVFVVASPSKRPIVSFERIFKKSPSDDEEENIKTLKKTEVPEETVTNECNEIEKRGTEGDKTREFEEPPEKILKKARFSWGKVEYSEGKAVFQNVEIKLLNKERSRVQCSLCKLVTQNRKGRKAINKMRTHIVATHCGVYQCPTCKKKCKDNHNLLTHMQIHENYVPEEKVCQICSLTCNSQSGLKTHMTRKHKESTNESTFNTISPSVLKDTISMVQTPGMTEKIGNSQTQTNMKRKAGRPFKYQNAPNRPGIVDKIGNSQTQTNKKRKVGRPFKNQHAPDHRPPKTTKMTALVMEHTVHQSKPIEITQRPEKSIKAQMPGKELITKSSGSGKPVKNLSGPRKSAVELSASRKFIKKLLESRKSVKGPSELGKSTATLAEPGPPTKKRRGRGPGRPKKSDSLDDSNKNVSIVNSAANSTKDLFSKNDRSHINVPEPFEIIIRHESTTETVGHKPGPGRRRKQLLSPASVTYHKNFTDEQSVAVASLNAPECPEPPKSPTPYIALNFNANSDSEESDSNIEEYFTVQSSKIADPLCVDEEIRKDTPKISQISSLADKAKNTPILTINKPTTIDIDLTESDTDNQDVIDFEDDEKMPIVTSTVSLATNPLLRQQLLEKPVITSQSASSFQSLNTPPTPLLTSLLAKPVFPAQTSSSFHNFSKPTTTHANVMLGNPTIPVKIIRPVINTSSGSSATFNPGTFTSTAANSETVSSRLAKEKHLKTLHNLETRELKLVEIVKNVSNDCNPVAVLSNLSSNKLCCGSCGYQNQVVYENNAAALRAMKIHIYQKHFFTQTL